MNTLDLHWKRNDSVLAPPDKSGGSVLLNLSNGEYYALDEVGGRVWELCDGSRTVRAVVEQICSEFDAPADIVRDDVVELLRELADERLVSQAGTSS